MKTTIGVYSSHDMALTAVVELKNNGYPIEHISIVGKAETEDLDSDLNIKPHYPLRIGGVTIGVVVGATLGTLAGAGVFEIPGLGLLFGAGALVGAIAGLDFGIIGGGVASILSTIGIQQEGVKKYHSYLEEGKYLLIVRGTHDNISQAMAILSKHGTHLDLDAHLLAEKTSPEVTEQNDESNEFK